MDTKKLSGMLIALDSEFRRIHQLTEQAPKTNGELLELLCELADATDDKDGHFGRFPRPQGSTEAYESSVADSGTVRADWSLAVKYLVCRLRDFPIVHDPTGSQFEVRSLYDGETYSQEIDQMNGESVTVFKRDGIEVDTAGEFCGEYDNAREARVVIDRLNRVSRVMDS